MEKQSIKWSIYRCKNISSKHYSTRDISVRKLICPEIDDLLYTMHSTTKDQFACAKKRFMIDHQQGKKLLSCSIQGTRQL